MFAIINTDFPCRQRYRSYQRFPFVYIYMQIHTAATVPSSQSDMGLIELLCVRVEAADDDAQVMLIGKILDTPTAGFRTSVACDSRRRAPTQMRGEHDQLCLRCRLQGPIIRKRYSDDLNYEL